MNAYSMHRINPPEEHPWRPKTERLRICVQLVPGSPHNFNPTLDPGPWTLDPGPRRHARGDGPPQEAAGGSEDLRPRRHRFRTCRCGRVRTGGHASARTSPEQSAPSVRGQAGPFLHACFRCGCGPRPLPLPSLGLPVPRWNLRPRRIPPPTDGRGTRPGPAGVEMEGLGPG